ncbi:hypothetical protein DERP_004934 [Dermatophagoides pteronyssinus]|uniref:protein-tyrosine-phosphatase n=1 Tax=Dermatophagoides pteronyssinus TaxID=6956 RepID=A0ABQ8JT29_DERPT|nr:hypothetical protein DERP_004934 [Dermatophagoides pteronyssinus]
MGSMADDRFQIDHIDVELDQYINNQPTNSLQHDDEIYLDQCSLRLNLLNRMTTNNTKKIDPLTSCELITPIYNGAYMCSVEKLFHSSRNLIEDLAIEHLIMIYYDCHPHNRRPLAALIEESVRPNHLKLSLSTIIRHFIRIPPGNTDHNDDDDNDAGPLGEQCYSCLMKLDTIMTKLSRRHRFLITYIQEQSDLVIAFASYSLSKCMSMSIAATYHHIRRRLNIVADSSQPTYSHLSDYRDQTAMIQRFLLLMHSIQTNCELNKLSNYHSFLEFVRRNKFDQLEPIGTSYTNHNAKKLAILLRQYHHHHAQSNNDDDQFLAKLASIYICQRCSYELFTDSNVLQPPSLSISAQNYEYNVNQNVQYCPSIFIEPMEWMFKSHESKQSSLHHRTIYCPKCRTVIGHFRLNGMNCRHKIMMGVCRQHPDKEARIFQIHLRMIYIKSSRYLPLILYRIWCHSRAQKRLRQESQSVFTRLFNLPSLSSTLANKQQQKYRLQKEQTMTTTTTSTSDNDNKSKLLFNCLSKIRQTMFMINQQTSNHNEPNRPPINQSISRDDKKQVIDEQDDTDSDVIPTSENNRINNVKTQEIKNNVGVRTRSNNRQTIIDQQLKQMILTGEHPTNNRLNPPPPPLPPQSQPDKFVDTGQNQSFSSSSLKSTHQNSNGLHHHEKNNDKTTLVKLPISQPSHQSSTTTTTPSSPLQSLLTSPIDSSDSSMSFDDDDDDEDLNVNDNKQIPIASSSTPPSSRTPSTPPKLLSSSSKTKKLIKSNESKKSMDHYKSKSNDIVIGRKSMEAKNRLSKHSSSTNINGHNHHHHRYDHDFDNKKNDEKIPKIMSMMLKPDGKKTTSSTYKIPKKKPETPPSPPLPSLTSKLKNSSSPSSVRQSSFVSHSNDNRTHSRTMKNGTLQSSQSPIVVKKNHNLHLKNNVDIRPGVGGSGSRRRFHQSPSPSASRASSSSSMTRSSTTIDVNKRCKLMQRTSTVMENNRYLPLNGPTTKIQNQSGRITSTTKTTSLHHTNRDR